MMRQARMHHCCRRSPGSRSARLAGLSAFFGWPMPVHSKALAPPSHPKFAEVRWPFPTDEWGEGKAFRCAAADCGVEVNVYIRAKIGFCNCPTGVSDDDELDRLSDFRLMGEKPSCWARPRDQDRLDEGPQPRLCRQPSPITRRVRCWRSRSTIAAMPSSPPSTVAHDPPTAIEPSVIAFLNSETIVHWAEVTLGL